MKKFVFYTYESSGRDCKVTIWADTKDEAWTEFNRRYGEDAPVDMVKEL